MVEVFVVSPGEHYVVQPNTRRVDAELCVVNIVIVVLVVLKRISSKDDSLVECAANREGVPDDVPLPIGSEEE